MADGDIDLSNPFYQAIISRGQQGGWGPMQIASAIGRAQVENGGQTIDPNGGGDGGTAHGGFQWRGDRFNQLQNVAQQMGTNWQDPQAQAEHYWKEQETNGGGAYGTALRSARTMDEANQAVISGEKPRGWTSGNPTAGEGYGKQLNYAQQAFAQLNGGGGNPADAPSAGASPASGQQTPAMVAAMQGGNATQSGMPQEPQTTWEKFKDGGPGALFGLPSQHPWDLGSALQGMAISGMAINNPAGANAMAQVPAMEARMNQPKWAFSGYNQDTGTVGVGNTRTGQFGVVHPPGAVPYQKIDGSAIQDFYGRDSDIAARSNIYNQMADARDKLISGQYDVSKYKNYIADWHNLTNSSDPNDRFIGQVGHLLYLKQQEAASLQKGSNSDKRAGMELQSIIPDGLHNDNAQVAQAFNNVLQSERTKLNSSIEAQRGDLSRPGAAMQMPKGRWDDPGYYGGIQKDMEDKETEFQPKYAKFLSAGPAAATPSSTLQGAGNMSGTAAPAGSTANTGGSLIKSFDTLGLKRKQ